MAYATTIFPAREAVDTLLKAWSWPGTSPDILWGAPTENEDVSFEQIYQGPPDVEEIVFPGLSLRNDEDYALRVYVDVRAYGDDERVTEERAWELTDEVMSMFRANTDLQGEVNPGVQGFNVSPVVLPSAPNQWRAQIRIEVNIRTIVPA